MWQRFTERARKVVYYAQEEAQRCGNGYVSTEHLLLGLLRDEESLGPVYLVKLGVDLTELRNAVENRMRQSDQKAENLTLTPGGKQVLDLANEESNSLKNRNIGTEHLLLGLAKEGEGIAATVLVSMGVTFETIKNLVIELQSQQTPEEPARQKADKLADYSPSGRALVYRAFAERAQLNHPTVTAEHFLLALCIDPNSIAGKVLSDLGATPEKIREALKVESDRG